MLRTNEQKPVWNATLIRIRPQYVSYRVPESLSHSGSGMLLYIRNSGMSRACWGSRLAAVNSPSMARLNLKLNRDTTNATQDDRSSVRITAGTVMMSELRKPWEKFPMSQAWA